jgi:hypothetical protein
MSAKSNSTISCLDRKTWDTKEEVGMSKCKFYLRRYRSTNGFGVVLFRSDGPLNPWQSSWMVSFRPRQRRLLVRLPRHLFGFSWWPPRFLNAATLWAER